MNLIPFRAHPLVKGGHLQTITGYYLGGPGELQHTKLHSVSVPGGDKVVLCENRPSTRSSFAPAVLLMHGLGGESASPYMLRLASLFKNRGWIAFRMNHRGSGEGRGLARNIYHSGRSDDISRVLLKVQELHPDTPIVAVGFSLSGNALLKLLGEGVHQIASQLMGAIAMTPPIDLSLCATAIGRTANRIYEMRFIRLLRDAIHSRQEVFTDFPAFRVPWHASIRDFDERITAPLNGFASAEDYYTKCSAKQFLAGISLPTVIIASDDDPFIPLESFADVPDNPAVQMEITRSGGHMGFVCAEPSPLGNRRWLDYAVVTCSEWFLKSERGFGFVVERSGKSG